MKNFKLISSILKITLALVITILPTQSIVGQDIDPIVLSKVSNGDIEATKKLLLDAGIDVKDEGSVSSTTQKVLQTIIINAPSATKQSTIEKAVSSLTQAVFGLATAAELGPEETKAAVEATAQGAIIAVVSEPSIKEANLSAAVAASSKSATSGAMLAASAAQQDTTATAVTVTEAAKAATEGSMIGLTELVKQNKPLSVIVYAVQAAAAGATQAATVTAVAVDADLAAIAIAVATSAETAADLKNKDKETTDAVNAAVSSGVQQGTLAGANDVGITGDAATELAQDAQAAADEVALIDYDSEDSDTPVPVFTDTTADETETASPSTGSNS